MSYFSEGVPLRRDVQDKDVWVYQNPNRKAVYYSKFLIDPVIISSNESSNRGISPKEETQLAESFREQLIASLKDGYQIVDKAGPDVLRIKTAILDIQPSHVELDEEKFLVLRLDTLLASVSMEMDCLDSVSGERVALLVHTLEDGRYRGKDKKQRLLNIRDAFTWWTTSLRERFDAAKRRPVVDLDGPDHDVHRRIKAEEGE